MRFTSICSNVLLGAALVTAAPAQSRAIGDPIPVDMIGMLSKYNDQINSALSKRDGNKSKKVCKHSTVTTRKEWRSLSQNERADYITAVQCLIGKRSQANRRKVPGARNRLDDFVASHLVEGDKIHFNGHLFAWHRHFVWLYEQALRKECGYKGAQPYWDWTLDSANLLASPLFDGSPYSMGSNGEYFAHGSTHLEAFGLKLDLPAGTGGGCLKTGPFKDLIVNLGLNQTISPPAGNVTAPIPKTIDTPSTTNPEPLTELDKVIKNVTDIVEEPFQLFEDVESVGVIKYNEALNYNPRCLRRDLNLEWAKMLDVANQQYLLTCPNVDCLERRIDGFEVNDPSQPAVHPAGHFVVGGLQNDPFASPGDPMFYLIHAQIDRLYSIWQAQDPANRLKQVGGTKKPLDIDHSGTPVSLEDKLAFGIVDGKRKLKKLLSTTDNFYCYHYA
ncbi:Di-copper centre-containing protein [Westerdykella ornata]|uniref:Di-copper centre-containing protein n=1 Tax=Westerdykella ornata TaxID=318751 RepID=A0A6A6JJV2_WESOR|nr:Di-copper centre-containing protein [Westerdykella ornata]KAF2276777.1 Di-copper centre-containing protein [Westerdykella ornata]